MVIVEYKHSMAAGLRAWHVRATDRIEAGGRWLNMASRSSNGSSVICIAAMVEKEIFTHAEEYT